MLISNQIEESVRKELASKLFANFDEDVARVCRSVEKHFGDPWTRVSEAMSGGNDDFEDISPEEAGLRLSEAVFDEKHVKPELSAFFYAWNGSIEQTGIGEHMKQIAMSSAAPRSQMQMNCCCQAPAKSCWPSPVWTANQLEVAVLVQYLSSFTPVTNWQSNLAALNDF